MAYSTILAYIANEEQASRVVSAAKSVAQKDNAHIVGLHVLPGVEVYPGISYPVDPRIFTDLADLYSRSADAAKDAFEAATKDGDFVSEWRQIESGGRPVAEIATQIARIADLVICGQPDPDRGDYAAIIMERLILESGRPVLIIPSIGRIRSIGTHPVIAWNGSKEAARAAFDAVPLIKDAKLTTLLEVVGGNRDTDLADATAGDMCAALDRHGVACELSRTTAPDISVGDEILSRLADKSADLLVMGGYGHSRMREFVLGGVTRHILQHMTTPVLMAH